jgi:predicted metal-dependent peptidase
MILHIEQIKKKAECKYTLLKIDYDTYINDRLRLIDKQTKIANNEKREYKIQEEKLNKVLQKIKK